MSDLHLRKRRLVDVVEGVSSFLCHRCGHLHFSHDCLIITVSASAVRLDVPSVLCR